MLKALMIEKLIGSMVRHGITGLGTVMMADGIGNAAQWEAASGGAVVAVGLGLSWAEKKFGIRF